MGIPENLVTVLGTLFGALLGAWLSAGHTHREKVWDLRREAYGVILSEIAMVNRIMSRVVEALKENPHGYFDSPSRPADEARVSEHLKKARQRFADDYLVLSDQFISIFEQMETDISSDDPNDGWLEDQERLAKAINQAHPLLTAQARNEVTKPARRWPRWPTSLPKIF